MVKKEHDVYLSLGSNLGNRILNLKKAISKIAETHTVLSISSVYISPPFDMVAKTDFLNLCIKISTSKSPDDLMSDLQCIEGLMGRVKYDSREYQSRLIDIDIIFFANQIVNTPDLKIPHLEYSRRKFVLIPLSEIASNYVDPTNSNSVIQSLKNCSDTSNISVHTENIHLSEL